MLESLTGAEVGGVGKPSRVSCSGSRVFNPGLENSRLENRFRAAALWRRAEGEWR